MQSKRDNDATFIFDCLGAGIPHFWNRAHQQKDSIQKPIILFPFIDVGYKI